MEDIQFWISIIATIAFAVTGVLAIADRGVDLFGVLVLGVITAIGGGTIRDIILGVPSFWSQAPLYVWLALLRWFRRSLIWDPGGIQGMAARFWFTSCTRHFGSGHRDWRRLIARCFSG